MAVLKVRVKALFFGSHDVIRWHVQTSTGECLHLPHCWDYDCVLARVESSDHIAYSDLDVKITTRLFVGMDLSVNGERGTIIATESCSDGSRVISLQRHEP